MSNPRTPSPAPATEAAASSELGERLLRRRTEPIGLIDVRQPEHQVARTSGWVAERFGWLDEWKTKYATGDQPPSEPATSLPFGLPAARDARAHDASAWTSMSHAAVDLDAGANVRAAAAARRTSEAAVAPPLSAPQFRVKRAGTPSVSAVGPGSPLVVARKPGGAPAQTTNASSAGRTGGQAGASGAPASVAPAPQADESSLARGVSAGGSSARDVSAGRAGRGADIVVRESTPARTTTIADPHPPLLRVSRGGGSPLTVMRRAAAGAPGAVPARSPETHTPDRPASGDAGSAREPGTRPGASASSARRDIGHEMASSSRVAAERSDAAHALPLRTAALGASVARAVAVSRGDALWLDSSPSSGASRSTPSPSSVPISSRPFAGSTLVQRRHATDTSGSSPTLGPMSPRAPAAAEVRADRSAASTSPMVWRQASPGSGSSDPRTSSAFDALGRSTATGAASIGAASIGAIRTLPRGDATMIARQTSDASGSSTSSAPRADASAAFAEPPNKPGPTGANVSRVADDVARLLARRVTIERERRGRGPWR